MKNFIFYLFLITFSSGLFAQQTTDTDQKTSQRNSIERESTIEELKESLEGTFRIEMTPSNKVLLYSKAFFEAIRAARKDNEDVILQWDQYTKVTVFSSQSLNSPNE